MISPQLIRTTVLFSITLGMLAACSGGSIPESQYYLLATPKIVGASNTAVAVSTASQSMGVSVTLPTYLHNDGIALVDDGREIHLANFHFWAEPLDEGVVRLLTDQLPISGVPTLSALAVDIHYLHGSTDGDVLIDASWTATQTCGEALGSRYGRSVRQRSDGYTALVEAHVQLLELLSDDIAEKLQAEPGCS